MTEFNNFRPYPLWTPTNLEIRAIELSDTQRHMYDLSLGAILGGGNRIPMSIHKDIVRGHAGGHKSEYFRVVKELARCRPKLWNEVTPCGCKYHIDLIDQVVDDGVRLRDSTLTDTYIMVFDHLTGKTTIRYTSEAERLVEVRTIGRLGMLIAQFITSIPRIPADSVVLINSVDDGERIALIKSIAITLEHTKYHNIYVATTSSLAVKRENGFGIVKFIHADDRVNAKISKADVSRELLSHRIAVALGYYLSDVYRGMCNWYGRKRVELLKAINERSPKHKLTDAKYAECYTRGVEDFLNTITKPTMDRPMLMDLYIKMCLDFRFLDEMVERVRAQNAHPTVEFVIVSPVVPFADPISSMRMFNDPLGVSDKSIDDVVDFIERESTTP